MSNRVLVTGANGFLGNHIVRNLTETGFDVVAMVRPGRSVEALEGVDCNIYEGHLSEIKDIEAIVKTCDFVIHCASMTSQNVTNFDNYKKANVITTQLLVKACKKYDIKRFIFVSTANCFTNGTIEDPGNERSGFMDWLKHSGYALSKNMAQNYVLHEVKAHHFPAVIVAPTFLVGPYDIKPSSGALMQYALNNKVLFYPKGGKSFVDVRAVASAITNSIKKGRIGECYLLSGVNLSYKAYFRKIAHLSGKNKWLLPVPKSLLLFLNAIHYCYPAKRTLLLKTNVRMLFLNNYFSNQKAKKELEMPGTNINSAIEETIKWFQRTHKKVNL